MKLLLDTQLLLWAAGQPERLSATARELLNDSRNELCFSAASLWGIAIFVAAAVSSSGAAGMCSATVASCRAKVEPLDPVAALCNSSRDLYKQLAERLDSVLGSCKAADILYRSAAASSL